MLRALRVSACVSLAVVAAPSGQGSDSARGRHPEPIPVVSDFSELRARPGDEQIRAVLFDGPHWSGRPLRDRPKLVDGPGFPMILPAPPEGVDPPLRPPAPSRQSVLREAICAADAVVSGQVTSKRAVLNKSETGLFTDFTFVVDQWLRPSPLSPSIVVSEFGGKVAVGGQVFTTNFPPDISSIVIDPSVEAPNRHRDMNLPTMRPHLLLLSRIPKTQSFTNRRYPIPIVNGQVDLVSLGPLSDPRGSEPFSEVAGEIATIAAGCAGG